MGAEVVTTVSMYFIAKKYLPISFFKKKYLNYIFGCMVMVIVLIAIPLLVNTSNLIILILQGVIGTSVYFAVLLIRKDEFMLQIISKIKK
jgi:hypothetical protein